MADDFTTREQELMAAAWQCFEEQPKIDFEKMAKLVNFSNPRSASNAWAGIKKKLAAKAARGGGGEDGEENGDAPKTAPKATPRKRGKKAADEDGAGGESPAKKAKATPKKRGGKKAAAETEEETKDENTADAESAPIKAEDTDELV